MEIHSSSLSFVARRLKANEFNDDQRFSNNNDSEATQNKTKLRLLSSAEIESDINSDDFKQLSVNINQQENLSTDPRSQRAINAYIQENIQPLKNQRSELISKIDFFV